tara:strand:+ start:5022 stop:5243 length:222 start_codon:yes stop_codon:yes gene_type:complete
MKMDKERFEKLTVKEGSPTLIAYHVAEQGEELLWTRIGTVWDHDDFHGLTIELDLMPVKGGRIVLRECIGDDE